MSEKLVWRVKRLVSGSVNGLVDALESANAESVMREAIREVESTVDDVREELGQVIAARHQAVRHVQKTKEKLEELAGKAAFAVDQGRDDLAEAAIARQMDLEAQMPVLETTITEAAAKQAELEGYVAALDGRKREMEADLAAFVAARSNAAEMAGIGCPHNVGASAERRADTARDAFDRAMNGPSGVPGAAKMERETAVKLAELDRAARSATIAERLAAVKATRKAG